MDGYMIDVQCDEQTLRIHAKTKAARAALTGWDPSIVVGDDGRQKVKMHAGETDVVIPRSEIAGVTWKGASMLVNGNLVVTTSDGRKYQLHFRKKQQAGFEGLARDLGAMLT